MRVAGGVGLRLTGLNILGLGAAGRAGQVVAKHLAGRLQVDVGFKQERGRGMPEIV